MLRFPADGVELQEWIAIVRKQRCEVDWIYSKQSKICSAHFRPEDLNKSGRRTLLMKGARPRIEVGIKSLSNAQEYPTYYPILCPIT